MKKRVLRVTALVSALVLAGSLSSQTHRNPPADTDAPEVRLPNGKLQQDEILKDEREKSIKDSAQLIDLAESLKQELEKEDAHVLSLSSIKKTEEIEKLAKRIRTRLKRF
jgi:hypothetical protein